MNEFKFSCPQCQQNIQATPEYSGLQIKCPACQTPLIVPEAPNPHAPQAPASVAPKQSKLSKAPSSVHHAATSPVAATAIVRQANKKPRTLFYVKLGAGAVALGAMIYLGPVLYDKYNQHKETVAAAAQAATNPPVPPPPPDLEANEILQKVGSTYKGLSSFSAQGESVGEIDMSAINPMLKDPVQSTAKLSVLLGRGGHYRIEWERDIGTGAKNVMKGAAWSAGKGDFMRTGTITKKMKNWETVLNDAAMSSGTLGINLAELFFGGTNSMAVALKNYAKTNNETLEGRKCYVLTGKIASQNLLFWIHKDDFMVAQAEIILGGKIDDSALTGLSAYQKTQMQMMSKIKGTIIETYSDIVTNKPVSDQAFQESFPPNPKTKARAPKAASAGGAGGRRAKP